MSRPRCPITDCRTLLGAGQALCEDHYSVLSPASRALLRSARRAERADTATAGVAWGAAVDVAVAEIHARMAFRRKGDSA